MTAFRLTSSILCAVVLCVPPLTSHSADTIAERELAAENSAEFRAAGGKILATQAGVSATIGDLVAQVARITPGNRLTGLRDAKVLNTELERILTARVLAKEATRLGLDKNGSVDKEVQLAMEQILARRLIESATPRLTPDQLRLAAKERYLVNKDAYRVAETRRVSHIYLSATTRSKADALLLALDVMGSLKKAGSSFEALAKLKSDDAATKDKGGALGDLSKDSPTTITNEVFAMQSLGLLSNPVEGPSGYHIIRVDKINPPTIRAFADVEGELIEEISANTKKNARIDVTSRLIGTKPYVINEEGMKKFFEVMGADSHALFNESPAR